MAATLKSLSQPKKFEEFVGQNRAVEILKIAVSAAQKSNAPVTHTILYGGPGLGKTTIANIIAEERGAKFHEFIATQISSAEDFFKYIHKNAKDGDIVFIDEVHALDKKTMEGLYRFMEDSENRPIKYLDKTLIKENVYDMRGIPTRQKIDKQPRLVEARGPDITIIGATTNMGKLTRPFRDRFGIAVELEPYSVETLTSIALSAGQAANIEIYPNAAEAIAKRSRRTARIALNIIDSCWRFLKAYDYKWIITSEVLEMAMQLEQIDPYGLHRIDRQYLKCLAAAPTPLGSKTAISMLGLEDEEILESEIEPYLLIIGAIEKSSRGRTITERGCEILEEVKDWS